MGVFALSFNSCSEDFDFEDAKKNNPQYEYSQNFIDKFGAIDPNQSWDFSKQRVSTRATGDPVVTKSSTNGWDGTNGDMAKKFNDGWYYVESSTVSWLTNTLKEGQVNVNLGNPFQYMAPSSEEFYLVPIYQGQASMSWDLHVRIGDTDPKDINLWSKSQGISTNSKENADKNTSNWNNLSSTGNTLSAKTVRSRMIKVSNVEYGTPLTFYLEITVGGNNWAAKDDKCSSIAVPGTTDGQKNVTKNGTTYTMKTMMLSLDMEDHGGTMPSNLPDGYDCWVIGCEDAYKSGSDWDYNDIVFLLIGKPRPPIIDVEPGETWRPRTKRYMVEDLGSTDDFDFNDIVIDLTEYQHVTWTIKEGLPDPNTYQYGEWGVGKASEAEVKALGGTLNFDFKVGGITVFKKSSAKTDGKLSTTYNNGYFSDNNISSGIMYNTDRSGSDGDGYYNTKASISTKFTISGWDYDQNNVSFVVYPSEKVSGNVNAYVGDKNADGSYEISFPENGTVPYIMAFSNEQDWNQERVGIFDNGTKIDTKKLMVNTSTGE